MKSALNLLLALLISVNLSAQNDTLTGHFSNYREVSAITLPWGFISGQNALDDVSKLMKFDMGYGVDTTKFIKSILFWVAGTENPLPNSLALANVWADTSGTPASILGNGFLDYGNIDTNFNSLNHINGQAYYNAEAVFNPPLKVPSNGIFYAGVQFSALSYIQQSYMHLKMTQNNAFVDAETHSWDQWNDFSFYHANFWQNDSNFAYAVFPVLGDTVNVPIKPDTIDLACDSIFEPMIGAYDPGELLSLRVQLTNHGPDLLKQGDSLDVTFSKNGVPFSQFKFPAVTDVPAGSSVPLDFGAALPMDTFPGPQGYCFAINVESDFNASNDESCVQITVRDTSNTGSTGIAEAVGRTTRIFPSPVSSVLNIEFASGAPDVAFIENQLGQRISNLYINVLSPKVQLNVEALKPGVYFLYEQRGVTHKRTKWMKR